MTLMSRGRPNKKQKIVELASPLFLDNGFRATSIDQVVKRSSISKPTIYNHFPDKSQLFQYVLNNQTDTLIAQWNRPEPAKIETKLTEVLLNSECLNFYRLLISEGHLVDSSIDYFNEGFDLLWKREATTIFADFLPFWSGELLVPYLLYQIDIKTVHKTFQRYLTNIQSN